MAKVTGGDEYVRNRLAQKLITHDVHVQVDFSGLKGLVALIKEQKSKRFLVNFEPEVIQPLAHSKIYKCLFRHQISVGTISNGIPWPHQVQCLPEELDGFRLARAVLVQADKISLVKGELYSLRRRVIDSGLVDFYGPDWNLGLFARIKRMTLEGIRTALSFKISLRNAPNYLKRRSGTNKAVTDKLSTMSRYKVALVVENSLETWTEKIFDAMAAGCIVVYVGPEIPSTILDHGTYFRAEPTVNSIRKELSAAVLLNYKDFMVKYGSTIQRQVSVYDETMCFESISIALSERLSS